MSSDSLTIDETAGGRKRKPGRASIEIPMGLSYDDELMLPVRSTIRSKQMVDTSTQLSRNIKLRVPIVSANMDTVTEWAMATEMARQGGIGIIHRFLPIDVQADEVRRVKRAESFVISQPYTISAGETVAGARTE